MYFYIHTCTHRHLVDHWEWWWRTYNNRADAGRVTGFPPAGPYAPLTCLSKWGGSLSTATASIGRGVPSPFGSGVIPHVRIQTSTPAAERTSPKPPRCWPGSSWALGVLVRRSLGPRIVMGVVGSHVERMQRQRTEPQQGVALLSLCSLPSRTKWEPQVQMEREVVLGKWGPNRWPL